MLTVLLLVLDATSGPGGLTDRLRGTAGALLGPAETVVSGAAGRVADAARGLSGRTRAREDALRRQADALRLQAETGQDDRRRAGELDTMLRVAGLGQYRVVPARVVAVAQQQDVARRVTIDAGSRDGVRRDMTVLSGQGLVGRVLSVAPATADVLLLTDPACSVGVRLEGTGRIGVATGAGADPLRLDLLDAQTDVRAGARLVTLGSEGDRPFVPGVPVGTVRSVAVSPGTLSRQGTVTPFVDTGALDLVGVVVQPPRHDPRDAVLPPKPSPSPTAGPAGSATRSATGSGS